MNYIIKVRKRENPYIIIDKTSLRDSRLTWRARGLFAFAMTMDVDETLSVQQLVMASPGGREAVQGALHELAGVGYARLLPVRDCNGTVHGKQWVIFETPELYKPPTDGKPVRR